MIYLLDNVKNSHSTFMFKILEQHTSASVSLIDIGETIGDLQKSIKDVMSIVITKDIILCPWAIPGNYFIDDIFEQLSLMCNVVVAAGNSSELIDKWTPTRATGVIVVGSLNKNGQQATHSNFSNTKKIEWVVGTNYHIDDQTQSGTSVASTLYAAFMAEAIEVKDYNLIKKLNDDYFIRCKIN